MARSAAALVCAAAFACLCVGASTATAAGDRSQFDIYAINSINSTEAMSHVESFNKMLQAIVPDGYDKDAPQATKLLVQTTSMIKAGAAHWPCGCEVAWNLKQKVDFVFTNTPAGSKDMSIPEVLFSCTTDAMCPGVLSSCNLHGSMGICHDMVSCYAVPACGGK